MNIPQASPLAFVRAHRGEIDAAMARVLDSGRYVLGPEVEAFEREFADFIGVAHAVGVGSGTEALWLSLKALGIRPGEEVITVSLTATATAAAIVEAGARPVFVDVCPDDMMMDPLCAAEAITSRTRAIVPVHLYGQVARMEEICSLGMPVVEDCAQAHGARCGGRMAGSWGCAGAFSFYPTKNMGGLGDGGAIATGDGALAARLREMREYGWRSRHVSAFHGWNSRLDEMQAAILRIRLRHLPEETEGRAAVAERYSRDLAGTGVVLPQAVAGRSCVWHQYVIRHPRRDHLRERLAMRGVGSTVHYPVPVHQQPAYRVPRSLPVTERAAREVLSLPMYAGLGGSEVGYICRAIAAICGGGEG